MADKNEQSINQPATKGGIGTPANPADTRRAATKVGTPIMQPPVGTVDQTPKVIDMEDLEAQLGGVKMAQQKDADLEPISFDPAKRKPGVKVYDANMVLARRRRILQNLGISDLVLPPITKQTMATYRVIQSHKINPATGKPNDPVPVSIPGTYLFYDLGEGDPSRRSIIMRNLTGKPGTEINPNTGKEETVPNASGYIDFHRGTTQCDTVKEFIKYVFLELHPLNKSNRFRDQKIPPVFERTDIIAVRTFMMDTAEMDMARDAEDTVLAMNKETVVAFAASANIPTMDNGRARAPGEIKHDLRVYARNSPKAFFSLSGNTKAAVRSNVIDLKVLGLIEFDPDKSRWYDFNTDQTIHIVPRGEDPTMSLVEVLNDPENIEMYEALIKLLNYWNRDDLQLAPYEAA
jgi:hypothetical protein